MGSTKHLHFASSRDGAAKTLKQERQSVLIKALILAFSIIFAFAFTFGESASASKAYAFESGDMSLQAASLSAESLSTAKAFNPKISKKSLKLKYNKSTTLKVTGNNGKKVTWSSSNKKAVQVKSTGAELAYAFLQ